MQHTHTHTPMYMYKDNRHHGITESKPATASVELNEFVHMMKQPTVYGVRIQYSPLGNVSIFKKKRKKQKK